MCLKCILVSKRKLGLVMSGRRCLCLLKCPKGKDPFDVGQLFKERTIRASDAKNYTRNKKGLQTSDWNTPAVKSGGPVGPVVCLGAPSYRCNLLAYLQWLSKKITFTVVP